MRKSSAVTHSMNIISLDDLKNIIADSNNDDIGGELMINGMNYRVMNSRGNHSMLGGYHRNQLELSIGGYTGNMNLPTQMQPELNISAVCHNPMNEQRSTDEPILI